jgi:orotate phosphoribosyltransferase-like protein
LPNRVLPTGNEPVLSNIEINKIKTLRGNGFTQEEIAKELNISRKTVENHLRKLKANYKPLSDKEIELINKASEILVNMLDDYHR